ncbi:hypothetical protein HHI36_017083 [Cryptolaemus montrouzieri]|uniref:Uncharacterized protein n=1 Tax=Cryptolaemus montrouzieri TaxID=559131 RepID=A0ABD2NLI6_9CUCU
MDEQIGSPGVDGNNVSRGSSIDAREIMERVRKSYNILIRNVLESDQATDVKVVEDVLKIIDEMAYSHEASISITCSATSKTFEYCLRQHKYSIYCFEEKISA